LIGLERPGILSRANRKGGLMAEAVFEQGGGHRDARERRARYLTRARAEGHRLLTASEVLAQPRDDPDPPSDGELETFIDAIYQARDRDRDRA
jgi:hypothetical protein